jgi:phosphoglycerate dehydrogenase-like enzyme
MAKPRILINLPPTFFTETDIDARFAPLDAWADVRRTSHNTPDEIRPDLAAADGVIMWSWPVLDEPLLQAAPGLRFAGHIDLTGAGARAELARGLKISLVKRGWSPAVAELALGLILCVLRRISDHHAAMRAGTESWVREMPRDFPPLERELSGRPVGIIGLGGVGRRLARLLAPFGCRIRACDPFLPEQVARDHGAELASLDETLSASDVVVLAAASNPGTAHLIGAPQIALLRENAVFVNVARAALVDTGALIQRLRRGDLFAALDVFDAEPLPADHPLRSLPNAYLSPHRAGGLRASVYRIVDWLVADCQAAFHDRPLQFPVTEQMLPALDGA